MVRQLDNGITVALEVLPHLHSFSAGIWIKTGSVHETETQAGLAHFLEHLFFKGTDTRNVHELMAAIEGRGGHLNAFTSREYTCLYVKMLDKHLPVGIEVLADLFKNSCFGDWEKERNVILEEIASVEDTPDEHVHDLLSAYHWPNHALGRSISGSHDTVAKLTRDDVVDYFNTWYYPENVVISLAGNFDPETAFQRIQEEFGVIPAKGAEPDPELEPQFRHGVEPVDSAISQTHLAMAFPGPSLGDMERYTCSVVGSVLGGGSTSRLFERIREDEGLAYSIYAYNSHYAATGLLGIYAATAPGQCGHALQLIYEELRKICEEPLTAEELEMNMEQIKGGMLMALESTFTRMSRMAKSLMHYDRVVPVQEILDNIDAVRIEDIQNFAQRTFTPKQCALVILGPSEQYQIGEVAL
jgi:predicted Zn-dependent peptidase